MGNLLPLVVFLHTRDYNASASMVGLELRQFQNCRTVLLVLGDADTYGST